MTSDRLARIGNYILLLFAIGSCFFIGAFINAKDTYLEVIAESDTEGSNGVTPYAEFLLSRPMLIFIIFSGLLILVKEMLSLHWATKFRINAASAILLMCLSIGIVQIIAYPA